MESTKKTSNGFRYVYACALRFLVVWNNACVYLMLVTLSFQSLAAGLSSNTTSPTPPQTISPTKNPLTAPALGVATTVVFPWTIYPPTARPNFPYTPGDKVSFWAVPVGSSNTDSSAALPGGSWSLTTNNTGGSISSGGTYTAGPKPGTDTVQYTDAKGLPGSINVNVVASASISPTPIQNTPATTTASALVSKTPTVPCSPTVTPTKTSAVVKLNQDMTVRDTVSKSQTCVYSASVKSSLSYVLSLSGIVGAAQLKVFNDVALTQPTTCIAPDNLSNSLYRQPADCTFVATGGTVYATVTGTSYLATANNSYNIRVSPYFDAPAAIQGTETSPVEIPVNKPFGGTSGPAWSDNSYYMVNTTGRAGDVVISMTGLTGWTGGSKGDATIALSIFDNPKFNGPKLDYVSCNTPDFRTFAESCILPAGNIYYLRVTTGRAGGSFTLMVDSPPFTVAPTATPAPPATLSPSALQQAIPASTTAP